MKYLRTLGLATVAAAALMAFAGVASATTLTSPAGNHVPIGTTVHLESEGHNTLDAPIGQLRCNSTMQGTTVTTGGSAETVRINLATLSFTGCTTATMHVLQAGSLEIHSIGSGNATLTWTGTQLTTETFGAHCIFGTNNTDIGTLTGGSPATLDISATIPRTGGKSGVFCGSSAPWTGSYKVTTPNPLLVS